MYVLDSTSQQELICYYMRSVRPLPKHLATPTADSTVMAMTYKVCLCQSIV